MGFRSMYLGGEFGGFEERALHRGRFHPHRSHRGSPWIAKSRQTIEVVPKGRLWRRLSA
jgi:hypothetical protein